MENEFVNHSHTKELLLGKVLFMLAHLSRCSTFMNYEKEN